jgi:hypothetical protein
MKGNPVNLRPTRAGMKTVLRFVAARTVSTTISLIVHKNADPETRYQEASVHIGAFVLGEWAGDAVKPFIDSQVDEIADMLAQSRAEIAEETKRKS